MGFAKGLHAPRQHGVADDRDGNVSAFCFVQHSGLPSEVRGLGFCMAMNIAEDELKCLSMS